MENTEDEQAKAVDDANKDDRYFFTHDDRNSTRDYISTRQPTRKALTAAPPAEEDEQAAAARRVQAAQRAKLAHQKVAEKRAQVAAAHAGGGRQHVLGSAKQLPPVTPRQDLDALEC